VAAEIGRTIAAMIASRTTTPFPHPSIGEIPVEAQVGEQRVFRSAPHWLAQSASSQSRDTGALPRPKGGDFSSESLTFQTDKGCPG
jgi:hypothetical protein